MNFEAFLQQNQPVILDGAVGTLLDKRGYPTPEPRWSAAVLETDPDSIRQIHTEYLNAGAQLITTVTFRTTRRIYENIGQPEMAESLTRRAVQLVRQAIGNRDAFIAGSVAPLEDCYRPDLVPDKKILYSEHQEQSNWLADAGVDCLLFETMNTVQEGVVCSELASQMGIPFFISFICRDTETILSGESIEDAFRAVKRFQPLGFLINCTDPETITSIFQNISNDIDLPIGAYANAGKSTPEQSGVIEGIYSPEEYLSQVKKWTEFNPILVGGCCGTTPEHIQVIHDFLHPD